MKYNFLILYLFLFIISSCTNKQVDSQQHLSDNEVNRTDSTLIHPNPIDSKQFYSLESLPNWVIESDLITDFVIQKDYQISTQFNPYYLEEDFNGDKIIDCFIPVIEKKSEKQGFAFIDGNTKEITIIGAGNLIKNALSDDFNHIDIWKINKLKENTGTEIDKNGDLIDSTPIYLDFPSINILKSESTSGIIYWNGNEFEYLHQGC